MSAPAIRSEPNSILRCLASAVAVALVLALPASPARAADAFESLAKKNAGLRAALETYRKARTDLWDAIEAEFGTDPHNTDWRAIDDEVELQKHQAYNELFDGLTAARDELTATVRGASVPDKQGLLEAYKEWLDAENQDIDNARVIGERMSFTMGTFALVLREQWMWVEKEIPLREALHGLAKAMATSYEHAEEVLAVEEDPSVVKMEAAVFLTFVYHAKTLEQTLAFHQEANEDLAREQSPKEELGGKVATARRLIDEAGFSSRGWRKALGAGVDQLQEWLDITEGNHATFLKSVKPWTEGTLLQGDPAPFDRLKFDEIKDCFGAMYGRLQARAM